MIALDLLAVLPVLGACGLTLFNVVRGWPGDEGTAQPGRVSVLVPARNEEANIGRCVAHALACDPPAAEVIVCDDRSEDGTPGILEAAAGEDDRLRWFTGRDMPEGWVGKPNACHQLGEAASGDLLVFVDADVGLTPDGLARVASVFERFDADVVTMFPQQLLRTWSERTALPLLPLTFTAWLPLNLIHEHPDPRFMAVSGQVMAFRREAYEALGGYEAVKAELVDDMAVCWRAKDVGLKVVFATGNRTAATRMYRGLGDLWRGFSKNFYEGLGENPWALLGVVLLYLAAFVWPYVWLGVSWTSLGAPAWGAVVGVALNLLMRGALAWRLGHTVGSVLLHPVGTLMLLGIGINSMLWSVRGQVQWRGRTYANRKTRVGR